RVSRAGSGVGEQRCPARSDERRRRAGGGQAAGRDGRARLPRCDRRRRPTHRRSQREDSRWDDVREHEASPQTSVGGYQRSHPSACPGGRLGDRGAGVSETIGRWRAVKGGGGFGGSAMTISRRVFVKSGGVALFSLGLDPLFLARAAYAATDRLTAYPPNRPILVCLFQRGAVDGLNMIVPHGDALYYRERPRIAVPATDVIDLDGYFGLHPRLAPLKPWWDA